MAERPKELNPDGAALGAAESLVDQLMHGGEASGGLPETAWIEVIQKMEEVYSDLIRYDVDLESKNAELEETHHFIGSVLSAMSDVLIVCDQQGQIQQLNAAALDLTGFAQSDLVGKPISTLLFEEGGEFLDRIMTNQCFGVTRDTDVALRSASGEATEPVSLNASTRVDQRGRPAGLVLVGRPMGELRRAYKALNRAHADLQKAQQQVIHSEKMASLGRLVAGVAHELNNPISFVYGNVHALERYGNRVREYLDALHAGAPPEEQAELRKSLRIDSIMEDLSPLIAGTLEGAERVSDIVKSLRQLSFSGKGNQEELDLSRVVETGVQWGQQASKRDVRVQCELADDLRVIGVAGRLHQVIVNLIENALDAVEGVSDAEIIVKGFRDGHEMIVTVCDNGTGISEENQGRIFDPFFTTKSVGKGTGLGLWISYGIVRDHGGQLSVKSRPESGTMFTIHLPAA